MHQSSVDTANLTKSVSQYKLSFKNTTLDRQWKRVGRRVGKQGDRQKGEKRKQKKGRSEKQTPDRYVDPLHYLHLGTVTGKSSSVESNPAVRLLQGGAAFCSSKILKMTLGLITKD